jgi:WD40 repeat protein
MSEDTLGKILVSMSLLGLILLSSGCGAFDPQKRYPIAICGQDEKGIALYRTEVALRGDRIDVGSWEEWVRLPEGASCPSQWWPGGYDPFDHSDFNEDQGWFVVGGGSAGLGGTVYQLDWETGHFERWFQLPEGDLVLDVAWTEDLGWQALTVGGNADCAALSSADEYLGVRCALRSGAVYLVSDGGQYEQILEPGPTGRCDCVLDPRNTWIACRESNLCFTAARPEASNQLIVADGITGETWTVPGDGQQSNPHWSPDGAHLLFESAVGQSTQVQRRVYVADVDTKQIKPLSIAPDDAEARSCALAPAPNAWSPDGQRFAQVCSEDTLELFDVEQGSADWIHTLDGGRLQGLTWSPTGDALAWSVVAEAPAFEFTVWDLEAERTYDVVWGRSEALTWPRWSPDGEMLAGVRRVDHQSYLELVGGRSLNVTETVSLPEGVSAIDVYWLAESR